MKLYLVGRVTRVDKDPSRFAWRLLLVTAKREKAEAACETKMDFVRPVDADRSLLDVSQVSMYFPRRK